MASWISSPRYAELGLCLGGLATLSIWAGALWVGMALEAILLLVAALALAAPGTLSLPFQPAAPLLAAALAGLLQIALSATVSPYATGVEVLQWLALAALACLAACDRDARRARLLDAAALFALAITVLATLQFFTSHGALFWLTPTGQPNVFGPFLSRNNFASFVLLFLPYYLARAASGQTWAAAAFAVAFAAIVSSGSRAGTALAVIETAALLLLHRTRLNRRTLALAAITAIALGVGGWEILAHKISDTDPLRYRREMISSAVRQTLDHPLTGSGLGTFSIVYPSVAPFDSGHFVNYAHNDWLEWTAEGGIVYGLILAAALLAAVRSTWGTPWALGLAALALHALVDYPFQRLGLAAWVVLIAVLAGRQFPNSYRQYGV